MTFVETERTKQMRKMHADGMSCRAIGDEVGLSKFRVWQIITIAEQIERGSREPDDRVGPCIGSVQL